MPTLERVLTPLIAPLLTAALLTAVALAGDPVRAAVLWPVPGGVVAEFDPPYPDWLPGHRGLDLAAPPGTEVRTPRTGIVAFVGRVGGTPVVVIRHGPVRATYQPVDSPLAVGVTVTAGAVIGTVVAQGAHCVVDCLHWGARLHERYIDPRLLSGRVTVVLREPADLGS